MKTAALMAALTAVFLIGCGGGGSSGESASAGQSGESSTGSNASGDAVSIVAEPGATNAFDAEQLEAAAGRPFSLELKNPDAEPHNLSVYASKGGETLFRGDFADPGEDITYKIPALPAGELYFQCDIHPEMSGTFKVSA